MLRSTEREMRRSGFVADEAIYVDAEGNQVGETSPNVARQIYGAGAAMSEADAKRFGVKRERQSAPEPVATGPTPEQLRATNEAQAKRIAELEEAIMRSAGAGKKADPVAQQGAPENKSGVPSATETGDAAPVAATKSDDDPDKTKAPSETP